MGLRIHLPGLFTVDYEFVSLQHAQEYPFYEGQLVSNKGLKISFSEYEQQFVEEHMEHANALHSVHAIAATTLSGRWLATTSILTS